MSKKIQVSTVKVEKPVEVQVINVNAYIIAKAVRASVALHNAFDGSITEDELPAVNKDGSLKSNANGEQMFEKVRSLDKYNCDCIEMAAAYDRAIAFIDELVKAFEEDE